MIFFKNFLMFSFLFQMNQPQQLNVACDFNGYLVCQMPQDVAEVELKIMTKWGRFTLLKDFTPGQRNIGPGISQPQSKNPL